MENKIEAITKTKFLKVETGDKPQYMIESKVFTKDITGKEFQISEAELAPIDKIAVLAHIDKQIAELQANRKELTDLDIVKK